MSVRKDTIFERFLAPVARLLIDQQEIKRLYQHIHWESAIARFVQPNLTYPEYYRSQNFHGIEGGYLNSGAAVTYDPITQYALPPNETWVRQSLIDGVMGQPRRILDLGCGTGSMTLMLKQAFPDAEVIGVDLSPYMLVVAEEKAKKAGLAIAFSQANAEQIHFPAASVDLISISLLFHETPPAISRLILRECFRLLTPGGQVLVLDGHQKILRQQGWLTNIFEEPYIQDYALESVDAWMGAAGFAAVQTQDVWLLHQLTRGVKPISNDPAVQVSSQWHKQVEKTSPNSDNLEPFPAPAFST